MSTTLAGILCIRNGDLLDYCWRESGKSMLGVCDELLICDSDSDDGTRQAMDEWAAKEPRITLANFPWTDPVRTNLFWLEWLNYARQHAKSEHVFFLDADEVLHEDSYDIIRRAAQSKQAIYCRRYNFWRDAQHLIPEGVCLGTKVLRCGPKPYWYPSDYPDPLGRSEPICSMAVESNAKIMHYGFLRRRDAFFRKARAVHRIWIGQIDPRLESAEHDAGNWMENSKVADWVNDVVPFKGTHPKAIHQWLTERGYKT